MFYRRVSFVDQADMLIPRGWRVDVAIGSFNVVVTLHRISDNALPPVGKMWVRDSSGESYSAITAVSVRPEPLSAKELREVRGKRFLNTYARATLGERKRRDVLLARYIAAGNTVEVFPTVSGLV